MTQQDKYTKIMEVMSDKTLSFGCIINNFGEIIRLQKDYKIIQNNESEKDIFIFGNDNDELSLNHKTEIIGHPLHIGGVLDWMDKQDVQRLDGRHPAQRSLLILWKDKRNSLAPTDEELVDYIYNLLP